MISPARAGVVPREKLVYDPLTGLVTFLGERECDPTDPGIYIVAAQGADLAVLGFSPSENRIVGSGAGLTYEHAFWAAAGETVERYCAAIVPEEDLVVGSYAELTRRNLAAAAPHRWALFDSSQFPGLALPPFTEDLRVAWVPARRLAGGQECHVPACLAYLCPDPRIYRSHGAELIGPSTSTGIACAGSELEARFKGLCEVIERDAFIIRWRGSLPCTRIEIDPASPIHAIYHDRFVRPGLEYTIFETTLDLPFHSFFGVLRDTRHPPTASSSAEPATRIPAKPSSRPSSNWPRASSGPTTYAPATSPPITTSPRSRPSSRAWNSTSSETSTTPSTSFSTTPPPARSPTSPPRTAAASAPPSTTPSPA